MNQSPFYSILGTDYVPTERECEMITEFLAGPESQLAELQGRIAEHESILQKLKLQREDLQVNISAHRAIISLFRRLPDDILREIFIHCLPHNRNPTMCAGEPPLLLTHVCQRWRRVTFSTPCLWSSLHILTHPTTVHCPETKLQSRDDRALQWIGRSGNTFLSLSFSSPRIEHFDRRSADTKRLLSLLAPSFSRWKKLEIYLGGPWDEIVQNLKLHDEQGRKPFHRVEQLSIRIGLSIGPHTRWNELPANLLTLLSELELDRNVYIQKLGLYFDHKITFHSELLRLLQFIPCDQLEVLDFQGLHLPDDGCQISIDILPSFLQAFPRLVVFKANIGQPRSVAQQPDSTSRIALDGLKQASLFFPNWKEGRALEFIARCHWPSLTSLYLRKHEPSYSNVYLLSVIVERFSRTLTSLRLSSSGISRHTLVDLMFALPMLAQLHLEHPALSLSYDGEEEFELYDEVPKEGVFDDSIITHLTPKTDGAPHALPLLRFLRWEMNTGFSDMALAHLLQQRASPYSLVPMKQVHITFGRVVQEDILPVCSNLVNAGLDLRLRYPPSLGPFVGESAYWRVEPIQPLDTDYRALGWD